MNNQNYLYRLAIEKLANQWTESYQTEILLN